MSILSKIRNYWSLNSRSHLGSGVKPPLGMICPLIMQSLYAWAQRYNLYGTSKNIPYVLIIIRRIYDWQERQAGNYTAGLCRGGLDFINMEIAEEVKTRLKDRELDQILEGRIIGMSEERLWSILEIMWDTPAQWN